MASPLSTQHSAPSTDFDVLILGAGAAGLAAARDLSAAGKRICVVEARGRVGGRVYTVRTPELALPLELGAEFLHGEASSTFAIVDAAPLLAYRLPDDHWWMRGGKRERIADFWKRVESVQARIGPVGHDISFSDFLRTQRGLSPRAKELARTFVEGYHAAHADRISALALKSADSEQEAPKQWRLAGGYDGIFDWLRAGLDPERCELRLETAVREVRWKRGQVIAETSRGELAAQTAVITLPIGVWKAPAGSSGAVRFVPELRGKRAAVAKLEVGHVVKIVFRFRERFWDDVNFIHSHDKWVRTWWTSAPARVPILTAWAGGHAADALLAEGSEALTTRVLDSLCGTFGIARRTLDDLLAAHWTHDWQADPFSRGAYSYAGVGGSGAHRELARPLSKTLFFAGEATSSDETGTVSGAIASGRRAAAELLGH
jgi:monoamine oxidase